MALVDRFEVVLMPQREVLATNLTLAEAVAFVGGYEEANPDGEQQAVIALGHQGALAPSSRLLRSRTAARTARPLVPLRLA